MFEAFFSKLFFAHFGRIRVFVKTHHITHTHTQTYDIIYIYISINLLNYCFRTFYYIIPILCRDTSKRAARMSIVHSAIYDVAGVRQHAIRSADKKGFDVENTSSAIIWDIYIYNIYTILTKQLLYGRRVVANILLLWTYRWLATNGGSQETHYRGLADFHLVWYIYYIVSIVKIFVLVGEKKNLYYLRLPHNNCYSWINHT